MSRTAVHLQRITGLKEARAKECFDAFGSYPVALASFAQSYASIPTDYFQDTQVAHTNAQKINDELRVIYRKARELKNASGKSDAEVWKVYSAEAEARPAAAATGSAFSFGTVDPAAGTAKFGFGAAAAASQPSVLGVAPDTAEPPKFGFGATPAAAATQPSVLGEAPKATTTSKQPPVFGFGTIQPSVPGVAPSTQGILAAPSPASSLPSATPAFGFGAAAKTGSPSVTTTAMGAAPATVFGFDKAVEKPAAAAAVVPESKAEAAAAAVEKKPVMYCEPKHFTGPYFDMPRFWQEEVVGRAPLLNLNNGFLEAHKDELRPRLEKWVAKAGFYRKPVRYVEIEDEDEEVIRVIIKDADRTFFDPEHRAKMVAFLNAMYHEFHAYGQAMSYLAGLCMLVLTEDETAAVVRFVATEYIKGHWAAEAVGFATSAWVVEHFMQKLQPEVARHLEVLNFWPDTYLQKILTGLCIHVLQFNELFEFLDAFMAGGMQYLIRFCLAIVEHFRTDLLAIKSSTEANGLYELMRLDSRVADREDVLTILARAPSIDLGEDGSSIDLIRSQVYTKRIEPRLQRAPKTETFEPCEVCGKNRPKWWNDDLGAVCDGCKAVEPDFEYEKY